MRPASNINMIGQVQDGIDAPPSEGQCLPKAALEVRAQKDSGQLEPEEKEVPYKFKSRSLVRNPREEYLWLTPSPYVEPPFHTRSYENLYRNENLEHHLRQE